MQRNWSAIETTRYSPRGAYSVAAVHNGTLYSSGITPRDPRTGEVVGSTATEQIDQIRQNVSSILAEASIELNSIFRVTVYLANVGRDRSAVDEAFQRWFPRPFPSRTIIGAKLDAILIELEFIASK